MAPWWHTGTTRAAQSHNCTPRYESYNGARSLRRARPSQGSARSGCRPCLFPTAPTFCWPLTAALRGRRESSGAMDRQAYSSRILQEFLTSGLAVSAANVCTNPIDVVKVRMQLQTLQLASDGTRLVAPNLLRTGVTMVQTEGYAALMSGVSATVARGLFYGGLRLGMYGPLKTAMGADTDPTALKKIAAGSASGAIATFITNPIELLKTRLQSNSAMAPLQVLQKIVRENGVGGLWKGTMPSAVRGTLLTASQCATYDDTKRMWMQTTGWRDGLGTHVGVSMITGLAATTITAPVDVVKTHMYCGGSKYAGPLACAADIARREGLRGFFKGWTANYARLGPQTTLMFVFMEHMRQLTGMKAL